MHNQTSNLFNFIKQRVSILQVINEYVVLKKAGYYWKGCCPFHDEKTASFTVSPHKEIFYCFGCHAGGDVISFITKVENCQPIDAVKQLADRYNINLPETVTSPEFYEKADDKKRYFQLCQIVSQWTEKQLEKYPSVISYLEKRGFTQESIKAFQVGYFPSGAKNFKTLTQELTENNFLIKDLLDVHLMEEGKGTFYSPFEDRVIFPIKDHLGRFCGFGGRIFKPDDQRSKYYNSRENNYFQKGSILFGFDKAKKTIQKSGQAFLVEGYTDCIAMVQHGYTNTVATLGTACTLEHLKLLAYHAQTVFLVYDADTAGHNAMLRLAELCWQVNLDLKTIFLPEGDDPASFLESSGDFNQLKEQAQDILSFFLINVGKEFSNQSLQEKLTGMRKILAVLKNLDDPLKQDILLQKAAAIFDIPFDSLKNELKRTKTQQILEPDLKTEIKPALAEISAIEKKFICAILNNRELLLKKEVARLVEYIAPDLQVIIDKLKAIEVITEKDGFLLFFDSLEYHEKQLVNNILLSNDDQADEQELESILLLLEKKYWKKIVGDTKLQIARAQQEDNAEKVNDIVVSFLTLKKKLLRRGLI
ncbi:DNA primase [bacterium]|nr:DNA primase [bacterium]